MSRSILYAEDEDANRLLVTQILIDAGYEVHAVEDGESAIRLLGQRAFDLLLLDIRMPGKGGLDVLRYAKEKELKPRVIMLTAVNELPVALNTVKLGANEYLTKPFDVQDLLAAIERLLRA